MAYAKVCVQQVLDYSILLTFRGIPSVSDLESLHSFNSTHVIEGLKAELPQYLAAAADVSHQVNVVEWWSSHKLDLPNWSKAFKQILLVQPSSAVFIERAFSILTKSFSSQQESCLEDDIQLSVQYNLIFLICTTCQSINFLSIIGGGKKHNRYNIEN